jgi:hemolysin activation/secretion protein
MLKRRIFPCALLLLTQGVLAALPPSAGSQMQQIPSVPIPSTDVPRPEVQPGSPPAAPASDLATIKVNSLHITGEKAFSEAQLLALTGFQPGAELTLSDLRGMTNKIAAFYHSQGYFVAQAYLPAQEIRDGAVTIAVLDGQYGTITLNNQSRLSTRLGTELISGINPGDPITSPPLETRLLLLSDVPGVKVNSALSPGDTLGTSNLRVGLTPADLISGSVDADNGGNRYTGIYRLGATLNLNNPTGNGDLATLRVLTSGSGLNYARASYQIQLDRAQVGVAYSAMRYELGKEFENLDAHGTAEIASIFGRYPLLRTRNNSVYAQAEYDHRTFQDKVDVTNSVTDKKADVLMLSLYGDHHDDFGGGGMDTYSVTLVPGKLDIETPVVKAFDADTARTNGHYEKLGFNGMRLQAVTDSFSLYGAINGQLAQKNLDISEKMELGGMAGVRAYPEGEAYGDEGYVLNLEARQQLTMFPQDIPGQFQLVGFFDNGHVTLDRDPWSSGTNHRSLSGAGVGLTWSAANNFLVKVEYAHKVGSGTATSAPDESGRIWAQAVKYF